MLENDEFEDRLEDVKKEIDQRKRAARVESRLTLMNRVLALLAFLGVFWFTWTPSDHLRSVVIAILATATILFVFQLAISFVIARTGKSQ